MVFNSLPILGQKAIPFDAGINTQYEEREPVISPDGSTMYFWRRKDPRNVGGVKDAGDIWYSRSWSEGRWTPARQLGDPFNTYGQEFIWQISSDEDTLWMVRNARGAGSSGAGYMVREFDDYWSRINPIHIRGFRFKGAYKDFSFSKDRTLILTNEGSESYGGSDLYICFPINDTAWTRPANLGPVINTPGDEDAPFLTADGRTLYFNSNGHGGEGDHDIWVSYRLDESWSNWSRPVNLGPPVNSSAYDFDFTLSPDERYGFWASAREGGRGDHDLYRIDLLKCGLEVYPQGDQLVCENEGITLEAGFLPRQEMKYQWYKDGKVLGGATQRQYKVEEEGRYFLVRKTESCLDTSEVQRIHMEETPQVSIQTPDGVLCVDDSVALRAEAPRAISFQWFFNDLPIPYSDRAVFQARRPGRYRVEVFNGLCYATSEELEIKRFDDPEIYSSIKHTPSLPRWLWTNKVPGTKKKSRLLDMAVDETGRSYLLLAYQKGGKEQLSIKGFSREGLFSGKFAGPELPKSSAAFMVHNPDGGVIVADEFHFLIKYSDKGEILWNKDRPTRDIRGLAVDPIGNIYVCAEYSDTLQLGAESYPPVGRDGLFLAKVSPRGAILWVKTFSMDPLRGRMGNCLQTDGMGNVYLMHSFRVVANFRDVILRASLAGDDYCVASFTSEGAFRWAQSLVAPKERPRIAAFCTDEKGITHLSANGKIWRLDEEGYERWKSNLLLPKGGRLEKISMSGYGGEAYMAGMTDAGEFFVSNLNRLDRQAIIWKGKKAYTGIEDYPALDIDVGGRVYVGGKSKGKSFPGAQFDQTSKSRIFLIKYGKPDGNFQRDPLVMCGGEKKMLSTREAEGLRYQWYFNGKPIKGATASTFMASKVGTYQVRAASELCDKLSAPRQLSSCDEDPMKNPLLKVVEEKSEDFPRTEEEKEPLVSFSLSGKPKRIKGRKIKTQKRFKLSGQKATLYLWDYGAMDRDTVSVNINGEWLVQNFPLKNEKAQFEVEFKPGDNYIILYALNLGGVPPNTASITVDDGRETKTLELNSTLESSGMLKIKVKD